MLSEKQQQIVAFSRKPGTVMCSVGTVRSGKTFATVIAYILYTQTLKIPYKHLILGRKLRVMEAELLPHVQSCAELLGLRYHYKSGTQTVFIGQQVYFVVAGNHSQSLERIQGLTCHSAMVDEATLIPENFFDMAMSRLMYEDSKTWMTCNPSYPGHYIKKKWIDENRVDEHLDFTFDDNPELTGAVKDRYKSQFTGVFKRRMIEGAWAAADGLIYYPYQCTEIEYTTDRRYKDQWYRVRSKMGADYGTANPTAYIPLYTLVKGQETVRYVPDSLYIDGGPEQINKSDKELCDQLVPYAKNHSTTVCIIDPNAASFDLELRKHARRTFAIRRGYRPVLPGIRMTQNALETGKVVISPNATDLLDEMDSYAWDPEKDDTPIKSNDHACDALRYVVADEMRSEMSINQVRLPRGM